MLASAFGSEPSKDERTGLLAQSQRNSGFERLVKSSWLAVSGKACGFEELGKHADSSPSKVLLAFGVAFHFSSLGNTAQREWRQRSLPFRARGATVILSRPRGQP